ncbi:heavy metal translocating P-type ATPase metal-binding domain-containing protein [uncultured Imperialibacter sp.]|uniref:heavy metal translocating P-type ATPase n=1 Tax=uncultured Imperialibacter sp. TaxID=1672639 RepID=UPI0030DC0EBD|tara:strand:+ start:2897 stop:5323 length:2427 start_codon:yes stop_codon:yes gene_type:complete
MQTTLPKKPVAEKTYCYHCGDECLFEPILAHEKHFCCEGCKTVYELLQDNGLCDYYELEQTPGLSLKQPKSSEAYEFLNEEVISKKLIDFTDGKTTKVTFYIPAIHCSSCLWLLENLPRLESSVISSRVNFVKKELTIAFQQDNVSLRKIVELLASIGYAPLITLEDEAKEQKKTSSPNRKLYAQLGVAGFCFGNIMLLSFPEYLGFDGDEEYLKKFVGYLNFLLALPVVFYSAQDYFVSAFKSLRKKFVNIDVPISLGIAALFLRSTYEVFLGGEAGYFDSLAGLLFFLLIGKWFQSKSYDHLSFERNYTSYFPLAVLKWVDGATRNIPVSDIKKGDILLIRNKELIPADGILISPSASVDYSFVTGESDPVKRTQNDLLYAGGRQQGASIKVLIEKNVSQSYLTQLWNHSSFVKENEEQYQQLINVIARYFTMAVMVLATGAFIFWWQQSPTLAVNAFTAVLIVACPCALALATPFTLGNTMVMMGKAGLFLKNTHIIEKMATINRLVFDKTGTLTYAKDGDVTLGGRYSDDELQAIFSVTSHSTHPLSRKLHELLSQRFTQKLPVDKFKEIENKGIEAAVNGKEYRIGSPSFCFEEARVSTTEGNVVYLAIDGITRGHFSIRTKTRSGLKQVIQKLAASFKTTLLSGDRSTEQTLMKEVFPEETPMYFNQTPEMKLEYVATCQASGEKVMMLGDGLNDAGALQKADVGMAISEDVASFSPASDAILDAGSFEKLPTFLLFSRRARQIIFICFGVSFAYNIVGLSFAMTGMLTPLLAAILMPVSSISIVALSTVLVRLVAGRLKLT